MTTVKDRFVKPDQLGYRQPRMKLGHGIADARREGHRERPCRHYRRLE